MQHLLELQLSSLNSSAFIPWSSSIFRDHTNQISLGRRSVKKVRSCPRQGWGLGIERGSDPEQAQQAHVLYHHQDLCTNSMVFSSMQVRRCPQR